MDVTFTESSVTADLCFTLLHYIVVGLERADLHRQLMLNTVGIDTADALGRSPLHWATIRGDVGAVDALLAHGASPISVDKEQQTPLHEVYQAPQSCQAECGRLLVNAGADVDAVDAWGRTPFRKAVRSESISHAFLEMLIKNGAQIDLKDMYSQTPLLKSISGNKETTRLLLEHGADTEASDAYGNVPILEAIYRNKPEHLQILLEYGAKTDRVFELQPGRRAREGPVSILNFTAWYGTVQVMHVLEASIQHVDHESWPMDDFEQHRDLRLANGLSAGAEEYQAFSCILSHMQRLYEVPRQPKCLVAADSDDDDDDGSEIFVDAGDCYNDDFSLV